MKLSDQTRNIAIDIFRGLTMILMIVVNDLWTVHGVPVWMEHTETDFDGMGLADVVFPMFLFAANVGGVRNVATIPAKPATLRPRKRASPSTSRSARLVSASRSAAVSSRFLSADRSID